MLESSFTATLIDDCLIRNSSISSNCAIVDIKPESPGRLLGAKVVVTDAPAGLGDLVPLARTLARRIGANAVERAESAGQNIPCGKGCAACCRYLVPLSMPEAIWMGRELESLSADYPEGAAEGLSATAVRILEAWPEYSSRKTYQGRRGVADSDEESLGRWYASLGLDCPFLHAEACTIYERRPLACREHMALGNPVHCEGFKPGLGEELEMPVKVLDALAHLAAEMEQTEVEAIMMPFLSSWYAENRHREARTWPGPELVMRFMDCLADTVSDAGADIPEAA